MVVFGMVAGQPGIKQEVVIPSGFGPQDVDAPFDPNGTRTFTTTTVFSRITTIYYSTKKGLSEKETTNFATGTIVSKVLPFIEDPSGLSNVFLAYNDAQYTFPPPATGSTFSVTNGANPNFPGWFVGTQFDAATGDVTNPFTGSVGVLSTGFVVTVDPVPEPTTMASVLTSGIGLGLYAWRRRRFQH